LEEEARRNFNNDDCMHNCKTKCQEDCLKDTDDQKEKDKGVYQKDKKELTKPLVPSSQFKQ